MPIYEYRCAACGHDLEALQKMADASLRKCPECGKSQLKRLVSAPQFRLKGSGWYETDFKNQNETKRNLVEKGGAGDGGDAASDKSTDAPAKEAAGKEVAAAKGEGEAAKPAKPKAKSVAASRRKAAAKPRPKAARR